MRALRVWIVSLSLVAFVLGLPCFGIIRDTTWKSFSNRAGWTVRYPANWQISSCHSCRDPKDPKVFVDFSPPAREDSEGFVMISHLADKPKSTDLEAWLREIASGANLCEHVTEERRAVNGLPAFTVRYRTVLKSYTEEVYVVDGNQTFSLEFSTDKPGVPLENSPHYAIFLKMVDTFRMDIAK